ncbi:hypothetical protein FBUS_08966 [Fasciolopsis buskii]|uniref:Uncharacterized protein n=1 Tax=Fasciolopsis buskii TaxID=27845 RepID=A0A8E0RX63_9TREM|nr:hypothetical protein FBUS_08966 [Fasciolopsis buski]
MVLHQTLCAATLGLRLARASDSRRKGCYTLLLLTFYVFLVPLGTGIGLRLHYTQQSSFNSSVCADSVSICTSSNSTTGIGQPGQMYTTVLMSVLQNFASSAFLYVVFMEMLPTELSRDSASETSCHMVCNDVVGVGANHIFRSHSLVSCFCAFLGFGFLALLRIFHHRDHS